MRPGPAVERPLGRDGFTLLEVMAAVLILAIWFVVIVGSGMQGLQAEGLSRRRLEATFLADRTLAQLEAQAVSGTVPEETDEFTEEDDYTIHIVVRPFVEAPTRGARPPPPPPNAEENPGLEALLATEIPDRVVDLRTLEVTVLWEEGMAEQSVVRTTYAFDLETARAAYEEAGIPNAFDQDQPTAEDGEDAPEAPEGGL